VGAPALHFAHGGSRKGTISMVVRGTAALLFANAYLSDGDGGGSSSSSSSGDDHIGGFPSSGEIAVVVIGIGAAVGGVLFAVVDDLALAREPPPSRQPAVSLAPTFFARPGSAALGFVGTF